MKTTIKLTYLAVLGLLFALPSLEASNLFWDSDANGANNNISTGAGLGGTGNWNSTQSVSPLLNWWPGTGTTDQAWVSNYSGILGSNNTAVFDGTAGTVTLTQHPILLDSLLFNTTGYTIVPTYQTSVLHPYPGGNHNFTLNNVAAATIIGSVDVTGDLTISGGVFNGFLTPGTLTATDADYAWAGKTTINQENLKLNGVGGLLVATSGITLNGGGIILQSVVSGTTNRVNDSAVITSNGAFIQYSNSGADTSSETLGTVALTSGRSTFYINAATTAGSQTLTLSGLTHTGAGNSSVVEFSTPGAVLSNTAEVIKVTGAAATPAGQIIGAWATTGTAAGTTSAQSDYAVYSASANVVSANIAASAETTWTTAANSYTLNAATALSATRTIESLRYTGAAGTLNLGANNLETNGILNGGSDTLTVSGAGVLRQKGTAAGNLYLITNSSITVNAAINDNTGALTLVKSGGVGTLTLGSTASNFSGGLVINAGTVSITDTTNLGALTGGVTFSNNGNLTITGTNKTFASGRAFNLNNGAVATINPTAASSTTTINGIISGSGGINATPVSGSALTLSGLNTYTGPTIVTTGALKAGVATTSSNGAFGNISAVYLANTAGVNLDITGFNNTIGSLSGGGTTGGNVILGAATLTTGGNNEIGGSTTTFAGVISGNGGALTKVGTGSQVLSGNNTYTGNTTVNSGTLLLADNAQLMFSIGASGVNNQINGAGTLTLNGDFNFDLTGAAAVGSWNIVNVASLTETFGATFSVVGFTDAGSNTWTKLNGGSTYTFAESTGLLTAVPEPATWALLTFTMTTVLVLRRRSNKGV